MLGWDIEFAGKSVAIYMRKRTNLQALPPYICGKIIPQIMSVNRTEISGRLKRSNSESYAPSTDYSRDFTFPEAKKYLTRPIMPPPTHQNPAIRNRLEAAQYDHYFVALDLDECSVLGSDTNDILEMATSMIKYNRDDHATLQRDDHATLLRDDNATLERIAQLVVNPAVKTTIENIRRKVGHRPYVFAYTNKSLILRKMTTCIYSLMRGPYRVPSLSNIIKHEFLNGDWTFLEGSDPREDYLYLWRWFKSNALGRTDEVPDEKDLIHEFTKLGLVTWAISRVLELDYNVPTVVSALKYKDLTTLQGTLGFKDKVYLFDDRALEHKQIMPPSRRPNNQMISVPAFETSSLYPERKRQIEFHLNSLLRPGFWERHPRLLKNASVPDPDWPQHKCIVNPHTRTFQIGQSSSTAHVPTPMWPIEEHFDEAAPARGSRTMSGPERY